MLIVLNHSATSHDVNAIKDIIISLGLKPVAIPGAERTAIGIIGNQGWIDDAPFSGLPGIKEIIHVTKPYKLVSRDFHPSDTIVSFGKKRTIGGRASLFVIAGPCAIESKDQIMKTAQYLKRLGVEALRGGAYKPRTSPHSFQGLREEGLRILDEARRRFGILTVTEVMSPDQVPLVARHVDILQIGARNMQNYDLLKEAGKAKNPVILKRGLAATLEEWLASAEYILLEGNNNVILCERGIRTFETSTRNTADLAMIPLVRQLSHLPVIFDPSHATGKRDLVVPLALASVVTGVHGIMVEVHPDPEHALSDGMQSLNLRAFSNLYRKINALHSYSRNKKLI